MVLWLWLGKQTWRKNPNQPVEGWFHKNVASNAEQILEAALNKVAAVRPPTTHHKTIQVRRTRHAGHCWRSKDELISDIILWTPPHGRAKAGRPARTYVQQLCSETGCSLEDLPGAMDDRDRWREWVREIRASGATWRWWWRYDSTWDWTQSPEPLALVNTLTINLMGRLNVI